MKAPLSLESRTRCEVRLSELTQTDITNLTEFAERRLAVTGLNPSAGQDVTQRALSAILQGLESDQGGRVPRLVDIENKATFLNFVRGAISSIMEAMGRKREFRTEHRLWADNVPASVDGTTLSPSRNAELSDLRDQLFPRLRARAPRRLKRTIDAWEGVFTESDRIPAPGHRRYVSEVKSLAREIISELGGIR
jgi:hypothetical protein